MAMEVAASTIGAGIYAFPYDSSSYCKAGLKNHKNNVLKHDIFFSLAPILSIL